MSSDPFLIAVGIIGTRELTDELLNEVIGMLPKITPDLNAETLDRIRKQLEVTIGISMVTGQGLHGGEQEPWLEEVKASIKWNYWNAYPRSKKGTTETSIHAGQCNPLHRCAGEADNSDQGLSLCTD